MAVIIHDENNPNVLTRAKNDLQHLRAADAQDQARIELITARRAERAGRILKLENLIERGVALASGSMLGEADLPAGFAASAVHRDAGSRAGGEIRTLESVERSHILDVLAEVGGNRAMAARLLGIDRVSLWRKLRRYEELGLIEAGDTEGALRVRDAPA